MTYDFGNHTSGFFETSFVTSTGGCTLGELAIVIILVLTVVFYLTHMVRRREEAMRNALATKGR